MAWNLFNTVASAVGITTGSTASRYGSYGSGVSRNGAGQDGYIRIAVA